jgi:short-subunit dehydrogenase
MPRRLEQATVVITGASSGIGRTAALRFARRAEERFGRIDVWVNNAGVIAYGEFLEIPSEVFAKVRRGPGPSGWSPARAALRRFRAQGTGVLINVSSVWGRVTSPQAAPYVTSKNAVRALSECLRGELADTPGIHVTTLAPQAVDTPIFDHGTNYSGRRIRPIPPVLSPAEVAAGIEACAERPKREVNYGRAGRLLEMLYALAPGLYRRLAHPAFVQGTLAPVEAPRSDGNVLASAGPHTTEGGWRTRRRRILSRAFLASAAGAAAGLVGIRAAAPKGSG